MILRCVSTSLSLIHLLKDVFFSYTSSNIAEHQGFVAEYIGGADAVYNVYRETTKINRLTQ